jgi:hypothetical protein
MDATQRCALTLADLRAVLEAGCAIAQEQALAVGLPADAITLTPRALLDAFHRHQQCQRRELLATIAALVEQACVSGYAVDAIELGAHERAILALDVGAVCYAADRPALPVIAANVEMALSLCRARYAG